MKQRRDARYLTIVSFSRLVLMLLALLHVFNSVKEVSKMIRLCLHYLEQNTPIHVYTLSYFTWKETTFCVI